MPQQSTSVSTHSAAFASARISRTKATNVLNAAPIWPHSRWTSCATTDCSTGSSRSCFRTFNAPSRTGPLRARARRAAMSPQQQPSLSSLQRSSPAGACSRRRWSRPCASWPAAPP
eukprot:Amastigsp_a515433_5.p3 type:complete len:116 gc:universal Amastigsp_a515433_5:686-339(-)